MKPVVSLLLLVAAATAMPQQAAVSGSAAATAATGKATTSINTVGTSAASAVGTTANAATIAAVRKPYLTQAEVGPRFYGPGVNNMGALRPQQHLLDHILRILPRVPKGFLVFVDITGEMNFTDQFGREVEFVDQFNQDVSEPLDLEEQAERLLDQRALELERRRAAFEQQLQREFGPVGPFATSRTGVAAAAPQTAGVGAAPAPQFRVRL